MKKKLNFFKNKNWFLIIALIFVLSFFTWKIYWGDMGFRFVGSDIAMADEGDSEGESEGDTSGGGADVNDEGGDYGLNDCWNYTCQGQQCWGGWSMYPTWFNGTLYCPPTCNNCAADTCTGQMCWNNCNWVSGTKNCCVGNYGASCTSGANECGQTRGGSIQCDGSCSASTPPNSDCPYCEPGCGDCSVSCGGGTQTCVRTDCYSWSQSCNTQSCCAGNQGAACTSGANACGQTNGGSIQCDGSCSASTPGNPSGYGNSCGSCGGTIDCNGNCTVATPGNYGASCGTCGGTIDCSGNCSWSCATLSVAKNGTGTGTVTGSGINCGATCSASYRVGTIVALTAVPSAGYVFYEWSGACSGAGACNVTVNADKSVVATFHKSLYVSLSAAPSSGNHPLTATLTATVSGTAVGTINYTFYCDRNDTGTNITLPADGKYDGQAATTKSHDCVYSSPGVFSPKVIVERDSNVPSATDKKTVTVLNRAPVASNLSAIQPNYCSVGPAAIFSWSFSDPDSVDTQAAYQVQVATNPGFSGPGTVVDTGKVSSASNSYATTQGILSYKTTYYWRARVWDNYDGVAAWAAGASFTTPKHQSPTVNFSWSPNSFSVNEPVQLVDLSQVYGGTTKQSWLWLIPDAAYLAGTNSSSPNPQVKFTSAGAKSVTLTLTDSDGFSCAMAKTLTVRLPLPGWKEIAP